jgi:hypothetical protein
MRKRGISLKKLLSLVIALSILMVSSSICYADSKDTSKVSAESADDYSTYLETNKDFDRNVGDVYADINMLSVNGAATETVAEFEGKKPVVKWNDGKGGITFSFNVLKDGFYNIAVGYHIYNKKKLKTKSPIIHILIFCDNIFFSL